MKKFRNLVLMLVLSATLLLGCEKHINVAYFKEATMAGSSNNTFSVVFLEDERFESKFYDILIKSDTENVSLTIKEEHGEEQEIEIEKSDNWYSLTTLLVKSEEMPDTEDFNALKDAVSKTYIITSKNKIELEFKVVSGDKFENYKQTGYLLANQENISKTFKLEVEPEKQEQS